MNKVSPNSVRLEKTVLCGIFTDPNSLPDILETIREEEFYYPKHRAIFSAVAKLFGNGTPVDETTVSEQLKKDGHDESEYLTNLITETIPDPNTIAYCYILKQLYIKREIIDAANETLKTAHEQTSDALDLLVNQELRLFNLVRGLQRKTDQSLEDIIIKAVKNELRGREANGILTGFSHLDNLLGTLQNSDLIILGGATSMGKTAMGLTLTYKIAGRGIPVGFISLEMPSVQVLGRFRAMETGVSLNRILGNRIHEDQVAVVQQADNNLSKLPIYIDDSSNINSLELRAKAVGMVRKHGIKLLVVDYLQLIAPDDYKQNREQQVSQTSRKLKGIAKELDIPVLCLCQVSRKVESREGNKPRLSDLRESGAIEQDADVVMFVYRPEYYGETGFRLEGDPLTGPERSPEGKAMLYIAKHRNGPIGKVPFDFDKQRTLFTDFTDEFAHQGSNNLPYKDDGNPF